MIKRQVSEETREKMRKSHLGKTASDEARKNMSIASQKRYENSHGTMLGKKQSEESKQKMRDSIRKKNEDNEFLKRRAESLKKKWQDPEYKQRMSDAHKGQKAWNKGLHKKLNNALEEWRKNGGVNWNRGKKYKGKPFSEESRKKISEIALV